MSIQWRLWSDWADAQADLSLRWAHKSFCWFCHAVAHNPLTPSEHPYFRNVWCTFSYLSQLMGLWYLSHRRPAKAQASLHIRAVSPEPLLFAHIKYGSRQRVRPKIRHLASLEGCACAFEVWVYGGRKVPWSHELAHFIFGRSSCMQIV